MTRAFFLVLASMLACAPSAQAQGVTSSSKSNYGISDRHKKLLDGRLAKQYEGSRRLLPVNDRIPRYLGAYSGEFLSMAEKAAVKFGIPKDLFARLVQTESNWNHGAVSPKGAIGLAQLMPTTAAKLGVDPHDPQANLEGGALYLKQQFIRFRSWRLALAAYNAGPEAVEKYNGVPPYDETEAYVAAILGN